MIHSELAQGVRMLSVRACVCASVRDIMLKRVPKGVIQGVTRPGVQQCQAQGLVFCPWLGSIQDRTSMHKISESEFFSLNM